MSNVNLSDGYIGMLTRQSDAIARLAQDESVFTAVVAVFAGEHRSPRTDIINAKRLSDWSDHANEAVEYRTAVRAVLSELSGERQYLIGQVEILLGILKILAHDPDDNVSDLSFWRQRAADAIATAEAGLASVLDLDDARFASLGHP